VSDEELLMLSTAAHRVEAAVTTAPTIVAVCDVLPLATTEPTPAPKICRSVLPKSFQSIFIHPSWLIVNYLRARFRTHRHLWCMT